MTQPPRDLAEARLDALDSAARHAARLRRAVGWLAVLVEPGREPRPAAPLLSDTALAAIAEQAAQDAVEDAELGAPRYALAPSPAPVRLDVVAVQARTVRTIGRLVRTVHRAGGRRFGVRVRLRTVAEALDWLAGTGDPPVWVADAGGQVRRRNALGDVNDVRLVERVADQLREAAEVARAAAGITTERVVPFPGGSCPACRHRSLQIDATLADERHWTVTCIRLACRCTGPGCGCRQRKPREGARHAWPYGELDGPYGLHRAIDSALQRHPVRSGTRGHGGWAERRTGPVAVDGDN